MQKLWPHYVSECHGIIFVIDGSQRECLADAKDSLIRVLKSRNMDNTSIALLINKVDLINDDQELVVEIKELYYPALSEIGVGGAQVFMGSALKGYYLLINVYHYLI